MLWVLTRCVFALVKTIPIQLKASKFTFVYFPPLCPLTRLTRPVTFLVDILYYEYKIVHIATT